MGDGGEGEVPSAENVEKVAVLVSAPEEGSIREILSEVSLLWTVDSSDVVTL